MSLFVIFTIYTKLKGNGISCKCFSDFICFSQEVGKIVDRRIEL